jgi:ribosomal-protein-serine acetyltransferase
MTGAGASRPPESLSGAGLVLTRWQESDVRELQTAVAANVEHLAPWLVWAGNRSRGTLATFLRESSDGWEKGERFEYGVRAEPARSLLGSVGLMARVGPGGLEIGYWVDKRQARRRVATRASALLTAAAFRMPGIERVEIHHDEANVASAGVPELLGFRRIGTFPVAPSGASGETGRETRWRMQAREFPASPAAALAAGP